MGAFDLPLRLPGQRYDAETALHYNYSRDYDPSVGGYRESDLIGLRGGLNTYAYDRGDPLWYTDPLGLAYFAMRPLNTPLGRFVGIVAPSLLQQLNLAFAHEQLFFEDGLPPSNLGFFDDGQVRPDTSTVGYVPTGGGYNDCIMRKAVTQTPALAQYCFLCANCQTWASEVKRQYAIAANNPVVQKECGCSIPSPSSGAAKGAAAAAGLYVLYRVVRMIPSLFVPPTIPANAAIP